MRAPCCIAVLACLCVLTVLSTLACNYSATELIQRVRPAFEYAIVYLPSVRKLHDLDSAEKVHAVHRALAAHAAWHWRYPLLFNAVRSPLT